MVSNWKPVKVNELASTPIFDLKCTSFQRQSDGKIADFYTIQCADWVEVLAVTPQKELVLVQQYRFGRQELHWEVAGGAVDKNETPQEAAARELREETGYTGDEPIILASMTSNPAFINNQAHVILILNAQKTQETQWDENEELAVERVPLTEIFRQVKEGRITHSIILGALLHLKLYLESV